MYIDLYQRTWSNKLYSAYIPFHLTGYLAFPCCGIRKATDIHFESFYSDFFFQFRSDFWQWHPQYLLYYKTSAHKYHEIILTNPLNLHVDAVTVWPNGLKHGSRNTIFHKFWRNVSVLTNKIKQRDQTWFQRGKMFGGKTMFHRV